MRPICASGLAFLLVNVVTGIKVGNTTISSAPSTSSAASSTKASTLPVKETTDNYGNPNGYGPCPTSSPPTITVEDGTTYPIAEDYYQTCGPYTPAPIDEKKECVLWDKSCTGDRQAALTAFFNDTWEPLFKDPCFASNQAYGNSHPGDMRRICPETEHLAASTVTAKVLSWMRAPLSCVESRYEFDSDWGKPKYEHDNCCGQCAVGSPNVEVYYWPSPDADTSCLSIIGDDPLPPHDDAITSCQKEGWVTGSYTKCYTFWETTTGTDTDGYPLATATASLQTYGDDKYMVTVKELEYNPWDKNDQTSEKATTGMSFAPVKKRDPFREKLVQPNFHPLKVRAASNGTVTHDAENPATVVIKGQTLTSPSVYVEFYSLSATDNCGYIPVNSKDYLEDTLIAFHPDELSTVAAPMGQIILRPSDSAPLPTSSYNFADLPCPPKDVMSKQWYSPEPGVPYRPFLALPSRIFELIPQWQGCTESTSNYFLGVDPPRTLVPATHMVPVITPAAEAGPKPDPASPAVAPGKPAEKTGDKQDPPVPDPTPAPETSKDPPKEQKPNDAANDQSEGEDKDDGKQDPVEKPKGGDPASSGKDAAQDPDGGHKDQPNDDPMKGAPESVGKKAPSAEQKVHEDPKSGPVNSTPNSDDSKNEHAKEKPSSDKQEQNLSQNFSPDIQDQGDKSDTGGPNAKSKQDKTHTGKSDAAKAKSFSPDQQKQKHVDLSNMGDDQMSSIKDALDPSVKQGANKPNERESKDANAQGPASDKSQASAESGHGTAPPDSIDPNDKPNQSGSKDQGNASNVNDGDGTQPSSQKQDTHQQTGVDNNADNKADSNANPPGIGQAINAGFGATPPDIGNPDSASNNADDASAETAGNDSESQREGSSHKGAESGGKDAGSGHGDGLGSSFDRVSEGKGEIPEGTPESSDGSGGGFGSGGIAGSKDGSGSDAGSGPNGPSGSYDTSSSHSPSGSNDSAGADGSSDSNDASDSHLTAGSPSHPSSNSPSHSDSASSSGSFPGSYASSGSNDSVGQDDSPGSNPFSNPPTSAESAQDSDINALSAPTSSDPQNPGQEEDGAKDNGSTTALTSNPASEQETPDQDDSPSNQQSGHSASAAPAAGGPDTVTQNGGGRDSSENNDTSPGKSISSVSGAVDEFATATATAAGNGVNMSGSSTPSTTTTGGLDGGGPTSAVPFEGHAARSIQRDMWLSRGVWMLGMVLGLWI